MTQTKISNKQLQADGWTPTTGWSYASATTITVPSGAELIYSVGDKFKLTANSVVLQGYIITIADTLLTVVGDALTNHAFSATYYSKAATPLGFPQWFAWVPSLTGGPADLSGYDSARFCISGRNVSIIFATNNRSLSGSAGAINVGLPVAASANVVGVRLHSAFYISTTYIYNRADVVASSTIIDISKDAFIGDWAANETGLYMRISGSYEI